MNLVNYLFSESKDLNKKLILGRNEEISYKEIYSEICKTANYLKVNCGKNEKIGIISENSSFFIISYLAIILSGNVAVPLSSRLESNKLQSIIDLCDMHFMFVQGKYSECVTRIRCINETERANMALNQSEEILEDETNEDDVCAIIFTSGTMGGLKGVMLSHKNIMANTQSIVDYLGIKKSDIQHIVLPFHYCFGTSLLHTHIKQGSSIVLNNSFMFTKTVIDDWKKYKCTSFSGVPSHYQILLKTKEFKKKIPKMRYMTQAGGKLDKEFIEQIIKIHKDIDFIVMYGQTEATARLSYLRPEMIHPKMGSIGQGIPGVKLRVMHGDEEAKPGQIGEIVASGDNIMKGYFKDEKETNKILKEDKLYTGDMATVDPEGYIYIVSRQKRFLKIGGNRVSPKEIEDVIKELSEVERCVVVGIKDEVLGEVPKVFIILKKGKKLTEKAITKYCKETLMDYKVPKEIKFIENFPLNEAGKIEFSKLKDL